MRDAGDGPVVVASNRGPLTFSRDEEGNLVAGRAAGGLAPALAAALEAAGGRWVASALTPGDRQRAEQGGGRIDHDAGYALRYLAFDPSRFDGYYNVLANRILWFCHHYLWDVPLAPRFTRATRDAWADYRHVNERFADALVEEAGAAGDGATYLLQDYHLALVPALLRERSPDARIAHFWHIPFAGPDYLAILPEPIRRGVLEGLLGADVVGFHVARWGDAFLASCRAQLGATVDMRRRIVRHDGREVRVRAYPMPVDGASLRRQASSPETAARRRRSRRDGELVIFRADRMELSKNIVRGFFAYMELLERRPEWRGRVRFVAHLYQSRLDVPEYRVYAEQCRRMVERINERFATAAWTPVELRVKDDIHAVIASYIEYDVLLVNPLFDGLNLVAKEGPVLNRNDGVLVLSRNAGAFEQLREHALAVNPFDVHETAEALHSALSMGPEERRRRARGLRRAAAAGDPRRWVERQLRDVG